MIATPVLVKVQVPRDTHLRLAPQACLVQRFHPALEGGFLRRPQCPGSSSLDVNRISPSDSPLSKSPATLNRTGKVQNITRFWLSSNVRERGESGNGKVGFLCEEAVEE
jgi:hypothetical protein